MCNRSKPGLVLLYGSYSCSRAQTIIFMIRCTALLSNRRLSGPTMRLFVDISWTFPKSSLFTEERSCWFPETTKSYTKQLDIITYFIYFKSCDQRLNKNTEKYNNANITHKYTRTGSTHFKKIIPGKCRANRANFCLASRVQFRNPSMNFMFLNFGTLCSCLNFYGSLTPCVNESHGVQNFVQLVTKISLPNNQGKGVLQISVPWKG